MLPLSQKIKFDGSALDFMLPLPPDADVVASSTASSLVTKPTEKPVLKPSIDYLITEEVKRLGPLVNKEGMHSTVFGDNIMVQLNNETSLGEAMEAIRRIWIQAIGR